MVKAVDPHVVSETSGEVVSSVFTFKNDYVMSVPTSNIVKTGEFGN